MFGYGSGCTLLRPQTAHLDESGLAAVCVWCTVRDSGLGHERHAEKVIKWGDTNQFLAW